MPCDGGRREVAGAVAVEPLPLVEHEAEGTDDVEVLGGGRVQRFGIGCELRVDPAATEVADLVRRGCYIVPLVIVLSSWRED
jgi:hypothetical protein